MPRVVGTGRLKSSLVLKFEFVNIFFTEALMHREEALNLVKKYVKNNNLIKHMLAAETVMKHFAARFGEDGEIGRAHV